MKYPNLIDQFEMIMQHVQDENYPEATATVATFKMRLVDFEEELQKAREKVSEYQYANAHLHAEIGELKEGLPTEKAKTDGTVYNYYVAAEEQWEHVEWAEALGWHYWDYYCDRAVIVHPERLYPLPSTETATEEGE